MKLTLVAWRRARNISQKNLAKKIGVHINTYIRWEKNPGKIPYDKALKTAEALGIELSDILLPSDITETDKKRRV